MWDHACGRSDEWSQSQELTQSIVANLRVAHVCGLQKRCERLQSCAHSTVGTSADRLCTQGGPVHIALFESSAGLQHLSPASLGRPTAVP